MRTNNLHQIVINEDDMIDVLYSGKQVNHLVVDEPEWVSNFNKHCLEFDLPFDMTWSKEEQQEEERFIQDNLADWNLPEYYQTFDINTFLLAQCETTTQIQRVQMEMIEFESRNMLNVLRWIKYFVDTLREHNLIWGVGRGSSVSSYILFLLGLHKVDSLKYDLSIKEFLK